MHTSVLPGAWIPLCAGQSQLPLGIFHSFRLGSAHASVQLGAELRCSIACPPRGVSSTWLRGSCCKFRQLITQTTECNNEGGCILRSSLGLIVRHFGIFILGLCIRVALKFASNILFYTQFSRAQNATKFKIT